MQDKSWQQLLLPSTDEDLLWELFHENSKLGRYTDALSDQEVCARMTQFKESLSFEGYPLVQLPEPLSEFPMSFAEILSSRVSVRNLKSVPLCLSQCSNVEF